MGKTPEVVVQVLTIETPSLGDRSYLVHDGRHGLVVDPQRDTDRVELAAAAAGVEIGAVAETHVHNDYVSGGHHLARTLGVDHLVNAADPVDFARRPVRNGDQLTVGTLTVRVLATPGHTHTHLSYVVTDTAGGAPAVFSGGSLLFGSVGRTDLIADEDTDGLTRAQLRSVRRLADAAPDDSELHPTHGFGSFCSSGPATGATRSTVGEQRRDNHALTTDDEDRFVAELVAGLSAHPTYYAHMAPANRAGPTAPDLSVPVPLATDELARRLADGGWVVDLRDHRAFAERHLAGAVSFGLGGSFTTQLGWTLPWGAPLTLLGSRAEVAEAVRELSRIGIDAPGAVTGADPSTMAGNHPVRSYRRAGWAELAAERPPLVLDVRRTDEFAARHVTGVRNIPLHELRHRTDELGPGTAWVHCQSGYRAGVAASLLDRAGRDTVHVDAALGDAAYDAADLPESGSHARTGRP